MSRATPAWILGFAFVVFLVYAYPGYVSIDSIQQLEESRAHAFGDWHPPSMAALWAVVELVVAGPVGMLLLQGSLLLGGSFVLLRRRFDDRIAALAAGALLLFPPVLAPMGVIWKDSMMAGMLATGLALFTCEDRKRRIGGFALLVFAITLRANAPLAVLPLFVLLGVRNVAWPRWRRYAAGLGLWVGATVASIALTGALTQKHQHAWSCSLGPYDITGIIRYSHEHYTDDELRKILDGTPLVAKLPVEEQARKAYSPRMWWPVANGDNRVFNWPENQAHRDAIARSWKTLVLGYPAGYLRHRWRVFRETIGLTSGPTFDPAWQEHLASPPLHLDASSGLLQRTLAKAVAWLGKTPLFRPFIYLALALVVLVVAIVRRRHDVLPIVLSGIAYELTLFPFAPSADYRYSHWMITSAVLAAVLLFVRAKRDAASGA